MELWTLLLTVAIGAYTFYYLCLRGLNTFEEAGIPHIKPLPLIGNSFPTIFRRLSLIEFVWKIYKIDSQAKYVGLYDFTTPLVVLRDLDLIKSVTVKNFKHFVDRRGLSDSSVEPLFGRNLFSLRGEKWKNMRNLLSPAFTSSKMKEMFKLMSECAENFAEYWAKAPAETRNCVDTKDAFTRYTNDTIATCAFGIAVDSLRNRDNEFYVYGRESTNLDAAATLKFAIMRSFPWLSKVLGLRLVREEIRRFFASVVESTIRARDEKGISRPDMIQLMMESRGKRGEHELSIDDMTSQAFTFFFGGFDSTSTLMCFAAHELAMNPDIQKRLQDEIDEVLKENNGTLSYEAVNSMKYLDALLNEAMRHYPLAPMLDRMCVKDFELPPALPGGKPYNMKKESCIGIPVYGIHMDPQYFPEPKKFDPERFLDENNDSANSAYLFAFGLGPRMCIGNRFALLEIKAMLIHLLSRCDLKPCEKTPNPIKFTKASFAVTPEGGFWLKIQPRSSAR